VAQGEELLSAIALDQPQPGDAPGQDAGCRRRAGAAGTCSPSARRRWAC
jgi:hypothetical protein